MAISPRSLVVKKSSIPGSGNGLFTKIFIPAGTRIIEYKGKVTSWKDADHEDGDNAYIYFLKRSHVIDARKNKKWLARYANDAKGLTRVKGITNNCEYVEDSSHVYIHSKKDIPAGGEILVPYGPEYWQVIRYNIRLAEKQQLAAAKTKKSVKAGSKTSGKKAGSKVLMPAAEKAAEKKATEKLSSGTKKTASGKGSPSLVQNFPLPPAKTHRTVRTREKQS